MDLRDSELLGRYVTGRDETALTELVHRHVDLVYSTALRRVGGDAHFAEDVVQEVFADFIRKAARLQGHMALSGWFYTSAHYAAAKLVRGERRRKARDQEAFLMNEIEASGGPEIRWASLRDVLEEAMHQLGERDRVAILMRYFERLPLAEVGQRLNVSENAAAKAVERALDRLRDSLARRGITSTAGALAVVLTGHAVTAAPAALAPAVTASLLSQTVGLTAGTISAIILMKKIAVALLVVLLVLMSGLAGYKTWKVRALESEVARLRMDNLPVLPRKSRGQVTTLASTAKPSAVPVSAAAPSEYQPRLFAEIRNEGRASPEAAYATFYWAMQQGDVKLLMEDVAYDDDGKAIFGKIFTELSPAAQAFYGTPEVMVAAVGCYQNIMHISRLEIVGAREHGPDATMLSYRRDGGPDLRSIPMVRGDDGWKVVGRGSIFMDRSRVVEFMKAADELATAAKGDGGTRIKMPGR